MKHKLILLVTSVILLATNHLFGEAYLGFSLSRNWATLNISPQGVVDYEHRTGYSPELYLDLGSEPLFLRFGIRYVPKGVVEKLTVAWEDPTYDLIILNSRNLVKLSYLETPIGISILPMENVRFDFSLYPAFLLSAKNKYEERRYYTYDGQTVEESSEGDLKDSFRSFDLGLSLGAEFYFNEYLYAVVSYEMGLLNIRKNGDDEKVRTGNLLLGIGISLYGGE